LIQLGSSLRSAASLWCFIRFCFCLQPHRRWILLLCCRQQIRRYQEAGYEVH
jgi:hypothetical protein